MTGSFYSRGEGSRDDFAVNGFRLFKQPLLFINVFYKKLISLRLIKEVQEKISQ